MIRKLVQTVVKYGVVLYIVQAATGFLIGLSLPWLHLFGVL